jgi:hypothetical protein
MRLVGELLEVGIEFDVAGVGLRDLGGWLGLERGEGGDRRMRIGMRVGRWVFGEDVRLRGT